MNDSLPSAWDGVSRGDALDALAIHLPEEAARFIRFVFRDLDGSVKRPQAGLLKSLSKGSMRISELAESEGLSQPTITALVDQAERHGWVQRKRDTEDGRVVIVSITRQGRAARRRLHKSIASVMQARTGSLRDEEIVALLELTHALERLNGAMQANE